jgi:hypothetical protein
VRNELVTALGLTDERFAALSGESRSHAFWTFPAETHGFGVDQTRNGSNSNTSGSSGRIRTYNPSVNSRKEYKRLILSIGVVLKRCPHGAQAIHPKPSALGGVDHCFGTGTFFTDRREIPLTTRQRVASCRLPVSKAAGPLSSRRYNRNSAR